MLVSLGLVLMLATAAVGTVGADPVNPKNAAVIPIMCGTSTLTVAVNGRGDFTPGHIIGTTGNIIPQAFTFIISGEDGRVIATETITKGGQRRGLRDSLTTCTFSQTFTEAGMTFTVDGTVTAFITPRGR